MTTKFQEKLAANTSEAVEHLKAQKTFNSVVEKLESLGFNVYSKTLLADNFRIFANIEWFVGESKFCHTILATKFDGVWGMDEFSNNDVDLLPELPKQYEVFLNTLLECLPGQINIRRHKSKCGCVETIYSVVVADVEFIDQWTIFNKCDVHLEEEQDNK